MQIQNLKKIAGLCFLLTLAIIILFRCYNSEQEKDKPRILISSDIGGTDPDDNQSIIHLLMYADLFQIEGLVASPYGNGRKENILEMINLYEKDLGKFLSQRPDNLMQRKADIYG